MRREGRRDGRRGRIEMRALFLQRTDRRTDGRFGTEFLLHRISVGPVVVAAAAPLLGGGCGVGAL